MFIRPLFGEVAILDNIIAESWDLTAVDWVVGNSPVVFKDQQGLGGVVDTASILGDNNTFGQETITDVTTIDDDSLVVVWRFFIRKDSYVGAFPQFSCHLTGGTTQYINVQLNTETGAMLKHGSLPGIGTSTFESNAVVKGGMDWWEVIISVTNNSTGNTVADTELFPAYTNTLGGTSATNRERAIRLGNAELYHDVKVSAVRGTQPVYTPTDPATTPIYDGQMMQYGGGQLLNSGQPTSGNLVTAVARFSRSAFTGGSTEGILSMQVGADSRLTIEVVSSDHATTANRSKLIVTSKASGPTTIMQLMSDVVVCDGEHHEVFIAYDAGNGTATFYIDKVDADDSGYASRTLTTGTLLSHSATWSFLGSINSGSRFGGEIGAFGFSDTYLIGPTEFMTTNGLSTVVDENMWTEWGYVQPIVWNAEGDLTANNGSQGNWTVSGTVTGPS